jgi:DNA-binding NarL/FixJ family response regulator
VLLIEAPSTHAGTRTIVSAPLAPRDRQIIRALATGATNREIAARLGLKEQTVKNRLSLLYGKLGARNPLELVVQARRHRLVDDEERNF